MPKKQWETDAKDRFLEFLKERGQIYGATAEDVIVNPITRQNFDYELTSNARPLPAIALEIFRLVADEADIGHHRAWTDITQRLETELKARGIDGYFIRTPHFDVPKFRRKQFAAEVADELAAAIFNDPEQEELKVDGYVIYRAEGAAGVVFSYIGGARSLNPFGSAQAALEGLLPTKNEQLDVQGRLRILLIVNAGMFQEEFYVRSYFSTAGMEQWPNVDRVYYERGPGKISLAFDRRVFDCYREEQLPDDDELGALFFPFLEHRLSSRDEKAFGIVKRIAQKYGTLDRLSADGKDALISCGERFVEEAEWPSVLWIIDQLKADADPPFPNAWHERIEKGEDARAIFSVRARLCWLIQKVVVHNLIGHYSSMLEIIKGYAKGPDFYVQTQCCIPLGEMAVRRRSKLPDGSWFMPRQIADEIKRLSFQMLQNAQANPVRLYYIGTVLRWVGDLDEQEASEVIESLSPVVETDGVHIWAGLLLYFALYRKGQFADLPRFDPAKFEALVHEELRNEKSRFRQSLVWQMAGGSDDPAFQFDLILPYLKSFLSAPYSRGFLHLRRICEVHIKDHGDGVCLLVYDALEKLLQYMAADPISRAWNMYEALEFFDLLSDNCDEQRVLDAIRLLLDYHDKIPGFPAGKLAHVAVRYESARALELRRRLEALLPRAPQ